MKLADHHPFRPIDDKGSLIGHQGDGSEIDILFLDIPDSLAAGILVQIVDNEADGDFHRHFIGHAPLKAFRLHHI